MKLTERIRPNGLTETLEANHGTVFYNSDNETPRAIAFKGKSTKKAWFYRFKTVEQREEYIKEWFTGLEKDAEARKKSMADREKPCELKVGDILNDTWGYEQTNQDFYQVVEVRGQYVVIQEVRSEIVRGAGFMAEYVKPIKDSFIGELMRKKVIYGKSVKSNCGWCSKMENIDEPVLASHYA